MTIASGTPEIGDSAASNNEYSRDITSRVTRAAANLSSAPVTFSPTLGAWVQASMAGRHTQVAFLQNRHMAVDMTDRGMVILPLLLDGRYLLRVGLRIAGAGWSTVIALGDVEPRRHGDPPASDGLVGVELTPGAVTIRAALPDGAQVGCTWRMVPDLPLMEVDLEIDPSDRAGAVSVSPEILWMPGNADVEHGSGAVWLQPVSVPPADEQITRNHSVLPDPPRPVGIPLSGVGIARLGPGAGPMVVGRQAIEVDHAILADRLIDGAAVDRLVLSPIEVDDTGPAPLRYAIGVAASVEAFRAATDAWRAWSRTATQGAAAGSRAQPLDIQTGSDEIDRQVPFSVVNSLSSRSLDADGRSIFIHGRRDRGYGDVGHLHQSYMLHFAALVAGEEASVRDDIMAYASLQDDRGDVARSPRPGSGWHPYAGLYSNAHLPLAVHRYISWSGDEAFLEEPIESRVVPGSTSSLIERLILAGDYLLQHRADGVIEPCGWCDGWPPEVIAQGQVSATSVIGLRQLAAICEIVGRSVEQTRFSMAAEELARRTVEVFLDPATGLFGEHLYRSGQVEGRHPDDFWSHTQIWAQLAGLSPDERGLDLARERCLSTGMRVVTPSSFGRPYIASSTDGYGALDIDFTATWLLASWPELTHLYGIAETIAGRPDHALAALLDQLPAAIHRRNHLASPLYYAEKYIAPGDVPWLCTWAGDPTLIELVLTGFGGLHADLRTLRFAPAMPSGWEGMTARLRWRGRHLRVRVAGSGHDVAALRVNDVAMGPPWELSASDAPDRDLDVEIALQPPNRPGE
jgi:hypothetical protein